MRTGVAILGLLSDADADWVLSAAERLALSDGEVLIADHSRPGAVFLLTDGWLKVTVGDPPTAVAELGPGSILGEVSFIDGWPSTAGVAATGTATVLRLDAEVLRAELLANEGFSSRFHRALTFALADRLRKTANKNQADQVDERSEAFREEVRAAEAQGEWLLARLNRKPH